MNDDYVRETMKEILDVSDEEYDRRKASHQKNTDSDEFLRLSSCRDAAVMVSNWGGDTDNLYHFDVGAFGRWCTVQGLDPNVVAAFIGDTFGRQLAAREDKKEVGRIIAENDLGHFQTQAGMLLFMTAWMYMQRHTELLEQLLQSVKEKPSA